MKKLLVLNLDETLIHATKEPKKEPHFKVGEYSVYKRPYLKAFLNFCNEHFNIGVWTSATKDYASEIVKEIFPKEIELKFLWARERCTAQRDFDNNDTIWIKDLKKLKRKGYKLSQIIVVDDSPEKLKRQYGNLVRIEPFYGDENDNELKKLQKYLKILKNTPNIREIDKRGWRRLVE